MATPRFQTFSFATRPGAETTPCLPSNFENPLRPSLIRKFFGSSAKQWASKKSKLFQRSTVSTVFSGIWRAQRGEKFCNARLGHPFSLASEARSAEKNFATLDWVTCFLWYLARAARRKFCFCNPSARSAEKNFATLDQVTRFLWYLEMLGQHWVSADGKKTRR